VKDFFHFRSGYKGRFEIKPCLHDWYEEGGTTRSEYFWQDLLVARMIFEAKPEKHVDIGSRVDGFVASVASFREIDVLDVRPITAQIPGVTFKQADLMRPLEGMEGYCDSLSCLHALEHFGLGRYGDPIDSNGFERGFAHMARLLKPGGKLILTAPFASLVHFAPYHYCTGFSRYWYEHHLPQSGFRIEELTPNGDWFAYCRQELTRLGSMARRYEDWT
jgi:Caenorhabditis protein of unknown function, DUF268.